MVVNGTSVSSPPLVGWRAPQHDGTRRSSSAIDCVAAPQPQMKSPFTGLTYLTYLRRRRSHVLPTGLIACTRQEDQFNGVFLC